VAKAAIGPSGCAGSDEPTNWHFIPVNKSGLSTRTTRVLLSAYADAATFPPFETIGAVAELSDRELLRWPGVGRRILEEIRGRVEELDVESCTVPRG